MWKKDSEIKKICWVRYSEKSCKWILYTKEGEDEDVPAKCVFAFDSCLELNSDFVTLMLDSELEFAICC